MAGKIWQTPKYNLVFHEDTGKLYEYKPTEISVIRAWPNPAAWHKTIENPQWRPYRPDITFPHENLEKSLQKILTFEDENGQLLIPQTVDKTDATDARRKAAKLRFFLSMPEQYRKDVLACDQRHWHMYVYLARCGTAATDLMYSNSALAFALASNWGFTNPPFSVHCVQ